MKKLLLLLVLLVLPVVLASDLTVEKVDRGSVVVSELDNPALFDLIIDNSGENDSFQIYSLVGVSMLPRGKIDVPYGTTKIEVWARPNEALRKNLGFLRFEYQLKGEKFGIFKDDLLVNVVPFKDVLEISGKPLGPDDTTATLVVKNREDAHLENVRIEFDSIFFSGGKTISLEPHEKVEVSLDVNKGAKAAAGPYIVFANLLGGGKDTEIEGVIDYLEKSEISSDKFSEGFVVRKTTYKKTNEGNVPAKASIEIKRDIVSRLFTINSPEPLSVERDGFFVTYSWMENISPGESLTVRSTTNYTIPFILIILVVLVGVVARTYLWRALILKKNVSFVKTKGGEFALKVSLHVKARRHTDNIQIIDSIPVMTKLYGKFGRKPDRIDHATRRMFWNVDKLARGEVRVYSYIIYSKLNIVGRFELPAAVAVFEKDGRTREAWSNKAYFAKEESN